MSVIGWHNKGAVRRGVPEGAKGSLRSVDPSGFEVEAKKREKQSKRSNPKNREEAERLWRQMTGGKEFGGMN